MLALIVLECACWLHLLYATTPTLLLLMEGNLLGRIDVYGTLLQIELQGKLTSAANEFSVIRSKFHESFLSVIRRCCASCLLPCFPYYIVCPHLPFTDGWGEVMIWLARFVEKVV